MFMRVALIYLGMTNDFGADLAPAIAEFIADGTELFTPPTDVYVTLFDDDGNELNADLENGRVAVATETGWTITGSEFENAEEIDFGEATADITVQEFGFYDSDTGGSNNELIRADITDAPESFTDGTRVFFEAGGLSTDILENE